MISGHAGSIGADRVDGVFVVVYERFEPGEEGLREALTSTGNGCLCARGAAEWEDASSVHYPGTYVHGGYNREMTVMGGRPVLNEDLVNLPNWLVLKLRIEGDDAISFETVELLEYRHEYDIRYALLSRTLRFRDRAGRETSLRSRRFVSMAHHHQAAIEWVITPENWSGRIEVVSAIDGRVTNRGVVRYAELEGRHLDPVSPQTFGPDIVALKVQSRQSNRYVAEAARTSVFRGDEPVDVGRTLLQTEDYIQQVVACDARAGEPVCVEQMVAFTPHATARSANRWGVQASPPVAIPGSPRRSKATSVRGTSCGVRGTCDCQVTIASSFSCAFTSPTSCRSAPATRRTGMPASRPEASTARPIADMSSGTSCTSSPSSTFAFPTSPADCGCTASGASARHGPTLARPVIAARCIRGEAAATAKRRRRASTSTHSRAGGSRTSVTTSATSTPPSSTTSGATTRRPRTSTSYVSTGPR
jgi:hypothetical protein